MMGSRFADLLNLHHRSRCAARPSSNVCQRQGALLWLLRQQRLMSAGNHCDTPSDLHRRAVARLRRDAPHLSRKALILRHNSVARPCMSMYSGVVLWNHHARTLLQATLSALTEGTPAAPAKRDSNNGSVQFECGTRAQLVLDHQVVDSQCLGT